VAPQGVEQGDIERVDRPLVRHGINYAQRTPEAAYA
jgi:hypothetical protein